MPYYRKRPVVVWAEKVTESETVTTVDGNIVVVPAGAYKVIDTRGFPYPCDAGVFEQTHDEVPGPKGL